MKKILSVIFTILFFNQIIGSDIAWTFPPLPISSVDVEEDPSVVVDANGNVTAVWSENGVVKASDLPLNGNWSMPVSLSSSIATASSPELEVDSSGNATVIWIENNSMKAASRPFGGSWNPSKMTPTILETSSLQRRVDSNGNTFAVHSPNSTDFAAVPPTKLAIELTPIDYKSDPLLSRTRRINPSTPRSKPIINTNISILQLPPAPAAIEATSSNAIDAPSGGALIGAQIGFAAGTSAPSNGLIVSGQVLLGSSTATALTVPLEVYTSTAANGPKFIDTGASGSGGGSVLQLLNDDGAAIAANDRVASIQFGGAVDASHTFATPIAISGFAAEAWSSTALGSYLGFFTTRSTTTTLTERLRIGASGGVTLSSGNNPTNLLDAPSGGTLTGAQIGFNAGTSAPINGLIVSGNVGVGTSSFATNAFFQANNSSTSLLAIKSSFGWGALTATSPVIELSRSSDGAVGIVSIGSISNSDAVYRARSDHHFYGNATEIVTFAEAGNVSVLLGNLSISTAGKGLNVKEGSNARMGTATLVGGTATVSTTAVTASSRIFLTSNTDGGTPGFVRVSARTAATNFTITSSSGTDTSTIAWIIFEPS